MRSFFCFVGAFILAVAFSIAGPVAAFDFSTSGVVGNGAASSASSSSGLSYAGSMGSASAIAGVASSSFTASQDQGSHASGWSNGGNHTANSVTNTNATGWSDISTASGAVGIAASGNFGEFQSINGSDAKASAFGGFGGTFDFNTGN